MKLIRKRVLLKAFAIFFLLEIVASTVAPGVSWALTSGPTMPEISGFMPVNSTQMVDKFTGSFGYDIPLLQISSPEGSYPINLTYQAGVKPGQEASFVGLGWNLSIGSINRFVNGHPDDYAGANVAVHDTWEGGNSYMEGAGLNLGVVGLWMEANWSTHGATVTDATLSLLGMSINTKKGTIGLSYKGISVEFDGEKITSVGVSKYGQSVDVDLTKPASHNNNQNKVQQQVVSKKDYLVYKYQKTRYWIDETDNSQVYGALQMHHLPETIPTTYAFDRTASGEIIYNPVFENDPNVIRENNEFLAGPSTPAFDVYSVTAQGLTANIEPVILDNPMLFDRDKLNMVAGQTTFDILYKRPLETPKRSFFRVKGDLSNSHRASNVTDYTLTPTGGAAIDREEGDLGYTRILGDTEGFNEDTNELAGSTRVQYFENSEIQTGIAKSKKFINYVRTVNRSTVTSANTNTSYNISQQIGGYSVTDGSGVTYHYALPVYTYENVQDFRKPDREGALTTRQIINNQPYAYVWMLTSVTGADFVDRNNNGLADQGDWGYWVNFVYGHTGNYKYRVPAEQGSYVMTADGSKSFSYGMKDTYYIDAIYSRTQTVFFVKDVRADGKGVSSLEQGGFGIQGSSVSAPAYKLNQIIQMDNKSLSETDVLSVINNISNLKADNYRLGYLLMRSQEVITKADADLYFPSKTAEIVRQINFGYDYSLCPETPNSMDITYPHTSQQNNGSGLGKLTLKSVEFKGNKGIGYLPAYKFSYETEDQVHYVATVSQARTNTLYVSEFPVAGMPSEVRAGHIVRFVVNGLQYYGVVVSTGGTIQIQNISNRSFTGLSGTIEFFVTKNPPQKSDLYDWWGYYKPDYSKEETIKSENDLYRRTSDLSAKTTDVWSLRKISTPMGENLKVSYGSNEYEYENVGVGSSLIINISNETGAIFDNSSEEYRMQRHPNHWDGGHLQYLKLYAVESDLLKYARAALKTGDMIDIVSYTEQYTSQNVVLNKFQLKGQTYVTPLTGKVRLEEIGSNFIRVSDPNDVFSDYVNANGNASWHFHYYSFIKIPQSKIYGDGVRVSSIISEDWLGATERTTYTFTGGSTASEPSKYSSLCKDKYAYEWDSFQPDIDNVELYEKEFQRGYSSLKQISELLPAPAVNYKTCTIRRYTDDVEWDHYEVYNFRVFTPDLIQARADDPEYHYSTVATTGGGHESRTLRIKDYTSMVGKVQSHSVVNTVDKSDVMETVFKTATDYEKYNNQGVLDQVFNEHRVVSRKSDGADVHYGTVTIRSTYPYILTGITETNYVTGVSESVINERYDFYSGQVTARSTRDGNGNMYLSDLTPAYRKYPDMGLAMNGGKNMLNEMSGVALYKIDKATGDKIGLVSMSAQTWSSSIPVVIPGTGQSTTAPGVWRPDASYTFVGSDSHTPVDATGLYAMGDVEEFTWWNGGEISTSWQKDGAFVLYDVFSHPREILDMNGQYTATKMDPLQKRVISSAINARYREYVCMDAENSSADPSLSLEDGVVDYSIHHTGKASLKLTKDQIGPRATVIVQHRLDPNFGEGASKSRNYKRLLHVSFWLYSDAEPAVQISHGNTTTWPQWHSFSLGDAKKAGNWYLCERDFPISTDITGSVVSPINISVKNVGDSPIYIDDFRVHPHDAGISGFIYDDFGNLEYSLNENNMYTRFEYDSEGKMTRSWLESFHGSSGSVQVLEKIYKYKGQND